MSKQAMSKPTMVYQPGSQYKSDGVSYNCKVVDAEEVKAALKDGWYKHFTDFPKAKKKVD